MTGKLLILSAAPLFMLYAAFAGELGLPGGNSAAQETPVEGPPVSCPDGRSFTSVFDVDGDRFHVLGTLVSMEGRSFVVAGPTGDVPLVLSATATVSAGLVVGEPAEASGSIGEFGDYVADSLVALCAESATPGPTAAPTSPPSPAGGDDDDDDDGVRALDSEKCNRGPGHAGELRLDVSHRGVDLKRGTVLESSADSLTVDALGGPVTVMITSDTKVKGDLSLASEVRIKGDLDGDTIVAEKAWALCPDAAHHDGDDDNDDDFGDQGGREDDDGDDDDKDGDED